MTSAVPRAEYPRPDRDRSQRWLPLNGEWNFECAQGRSAIVVPFAWETAASGVGRTWLEDATYRRLLTVPGEWDGARVFLCFGAVHHEARVSIDGVLLGSHVGGYEPFEFDISESVAAGTTAEVRVDVHAPADKRAIPHGKQRSIPRDDYDGVSFTPSSGIWQSVWLEARGRTYFSTISVRGDSLTGFDISGELAGDSPARTRVEVAVVGGSAHREKAELVADAQGRITGRLEIAEPGLWSPDDPHLYSLEFTAGTAEADRVTVTGGLRRIEIRGEQLYLNAERLYVRGVLDQGYWPGTGATAPSDTALVRDLELARDSGYTLVRKHIKLEEPRWLHHADRMGMLVWAEPPGPSRFSDVAARTFEAQLRPMVDRDGNHPSIIIWSLYNEEWGLDWDIPGSPPRAAAAARAYDIMRGLDPSRPIVENSGWAHVKTDLVDWHYYDDDPLTWATNVAALATGERADFPVRLGPDFVVDKPLYADTHHPRSGVPVLNSEYGSGFTSLERAWQLRWQTQELRRHDRFAGYVYTELTDIEHEMAGIFFADRTRKDLGGLHPSDVNGDTVLVLDLVPARAGADMPVPDGPFTIDVHVSHHGVAAIAGRVRAAWVPPGTPFGPHLHEHQAESEPVKAEPYTLSAAVRLEVPPPGAVPSARLQLWLVDDAGDVQARTFVDAAPIEAPNRRGERPY